MVAFNGAAVVSGALSSGARAAAEQEAVQAWLFSRPENDHLIASVIEVVGADDPSRRGRISAALIARGAGRFFRVPDLGRAHESRAAAEAGDESPPAIARHEHHARAIGIRQQ